MKFISFLTTSFSIVLIGISMSSCKRSSGDIVEDTRSTGRYMGRGLRTLTGTNTDSRQIDSASDFQGPTQDQYIPFNEEELDKNSSRQAGMPHPQSIEAPGEIGSALPGIEGFRDPVAFNIDHIFQKVHFDTDDYVIRGKENFTILKNISAYLKQHPSIYLFIEGHCDERASEAYNLALGLRRSNSVREYLIKESVDANRLFTISYGNLRPLQLGHSPQDWQQNRRVQFKLYERS